MSDVCVSVCACSQERLEAYRTAQDDKTKLVAAAESHRRRCIANVREEARLGKERARVEIYAINAILRM